MSWLAVTFRFAMASWAVMGGVGGVLMSGLALAQSTLRVDVPQECGSQPEFEREVAALQRTSQAQLTVSEVVISRKNDQMWELRLTTPEGPRVVEDPDCRTLFKTAAVITATLARAEMETSAEPPAATPEVVGTPSDSAPRSEGQPLNEPPAIDPVPVAKPRPESGATPLPEVPETPADVHSPQAPLRPELGVGVGGYLGLTPDPHVGVEVIAGITGARWGGHLAGKILPPRNMTVRGELGLRETVWGARLGTSLVLTAWLRASLDVSGYWISAQGLGISEPLSDSIGLVAPELELSVTVLEQPAFRAELALQGRVGLTQPRFEVEPGGVVYQLPRLGGAGVLRILWTKQ